MKLIGFDIETAGEGEAFGLQPYRVLQGRARITSYAFVEESGEVIASGLEPSQEDLYNAFTQVHLLYGTDYTLISHNTQFDVAWLIAFGFQKACRSNQWLDTEVLRRALENDTSDKPYGLKPTVAKYLPEFAGYEAAVNGNFDQVDETLLKYNILDAGLTAKLGRIFWDQLDTRRQILCQVISQCIIPVAGSWVEGLTIDMTAVEKWDEACGKEIDAQWSEICRLLPVEETEIDSSFINSPIKLKKILQLLGHDVAKTDRDELSKFKEVPLIKAISDYKQANTSRTKFIAGIRKSLEYNGADRTHPSCRLWNTYTGRFGYSSKTLKKFQTGIAIHQFPRKSEARSCIVAPDGYLLAEYDFATQESRLLCDFSGDETLQEIFDNNLDFHAYMASRIAEVNYLDMVDRIQQKDAEAKNYRQLAKVVNLSCAYRTGWKKLIDVARTQFDVDIDASVARRLHGLFRTTYNKVPVYWDAAVQSAMEQGYAETRGGRRVYIEDWSRANLWSAESTAINFPIQGTAADMKVLAIAAIDKSLHDGGGKYLLDLHDALFCLVPDTSKGYDLAVQLQSSLSNLPYKEIYNWDPRVALPVDFKWGKSWGALEQQ